MKKAIRFSGFFVVLMLLVLLAPNALAVGEIDVTTAQQGYFTVNYNGDANIRMKVGVSFGTSTTYYDYVAGTSSSYPFLSGNGSYHITLYRNTSGTSYKKVVTAAADVKMADLLAPYRVSTADITFAADDIVGLTAAAVVEGRDTVSGKAAAIYNYISSNFTYDYELAARINRGEKHKSVAGTILAAKKGICNDLATAYAAMCRSQGIVCKVTKGYMDGQYHAWNQVYDNGIWYTVDTTYGIAYRTSNAQNLSDCVSPMGYSAIASW